MLRNIFALVSAVVLSVTYSHAQDEKRTRSIEEDKKLLTASKWQNEKPEAAWNKLSYVHKEQLGGKPWKKVELEIMKLGDSPDPQGRTHSVQLSFFKPDGEKFSFGPASVEIREEKGKRLLVVTNLDQIEYQIEYEFIGDKLQMRGSYLRREPSSGAIFIPEVFDGDYVAIPLKKKLAAEPGAAPEPAVKLYYVGEAKVSSADGKAMGSQVYLLEKTLDRDKATITERAVIVREDGNAEEWTMRFAVKEDATFTLTEDSKKAEGSGKLFGPAWKWTYFKATYKSTNGIQVQDENFMADESFGTARQKLTGPDNKVMMYMDISLKSITPKTYEILRAGLLKK